jgi:carboxymethylenebutenolidase
MQTRTETITAPDGDTFDGYLVLPDAGTGPGILVLQEIFGVNDYIREVCQRLARLGYVAMAPDVFWRIERNVELGGDQDALQQAYGYITQYDWEKGVPDLVTALAHLRGLPETGGRAGALGFCFGGVTSFVLGCVSDPDVVVSYYGSGVPDWLDKAEELIAPTLLHFGANDPFIPAERIDAVREWAEPRPHVEFHDYQAGHAFDNHTSAMFSNPEAATNAWERTKNFLAEHFPVGEAAP